MQRNINTHWHHKTRVFSLFIPREDTNNKTMPIRCVMRYKLYCWLMIANLIFWSRVLSYRLCELLSIPHNSPHPAHNHVIIFIFSSSEKKEGKRCLNFANLSAKKLLYIRKGVKSWTKFKIISLQSILKHRFEQLTRKCLFVKFIKVFTFSMMHSSLGLLVSGHAQHGFSLLPSLSTG